MSKFSSIPKLEKLPNFKRRHSENASKDENHKKNKELLILPPLTQTMSTTPPIPFYDPSSHALLHMNSRLSSSKFDGRPSTPWHSNGSRSSRSHSL